MGGGSGSMKLSMGLTPRYGGEMLDIHRQFSWGKTWKKICKIKINSFFHNQQINANKVVEL